ncbi:MAG: hypothetical protein MZW92_19705 [Comamonadaceae bacterium]|nr:hypothetical protein [Comamonadaceae bacterium]
MPFHLPAGTPTRQDPAAPSRPADTPLAAAGGDEAPDAATVELIQRVLDAIPPAPPRREPAAGAARDSGYDRAAAAGRDSGFGPRVTAPTARCRRAPATAAGCWSRWRSRWSPAARSGGRRGRAARRRRPASRW